MCVSREADPADPAAQAAEDVARLLNRPALPRRHVGTRVRALPLAGGVSARQGRPPPILPANGGGSGGLPAAVSPADPPAGTEHPAHRGEPIALDVSPP